MDRETERMLLRGDGGRPAIKDVRPVLPPTSYPDFRRSWPGSMVSDPLIDYVLDLCDGLRPYGHLSTRAGQSLLSLSRAMAVLDGRSYVVPDDVKALAVPCLAHRLAAEGERIDARQAQVRTSVEDRPVPDAAT